MYKEHGRRSVDGCSGGAYGRQRRDRRLSRYVLAHEASDFPRNEHYGKTIITAYACIDG